MSSIYHMSSIIGYKYAKNINNNIVILTLQIPNDAIHNIHRNNIVNVQYAKYRANKVIVLDITDIKTNIKYNEAYSCFNPFFKYVLNQISIEYNYDIDSNKTCSSGIHFFLDKDLTIYTSTSLSPYNENGELWLKPLSESIKMIF